MHDHQRVDIPCQDTERCEDSVAGSTYDDKVTQYLADAMLCIHEDDVDAEYFDEQNYAEGEFDDEEEDTKKDFLPKKASLTR